MVNTNVNIACQIVIQLAGTTIKTITWDGSFGSYQVISASVFGTGQTQSLAILLVCGSASSTYDSGIFLDTISAIAS
jgi:hypothetical protein